MLSAAYDLISVSKFKNMKRNSMGFTYSLNRVRDLLVGVSLLQC